MFKKHLNPDQQTRQARPGTASPFSIEGLEDRRLLSHGFGGGFGGGGHGFGDHGGAAISTITFAQAPTAVQTGLTALAATDNVAAPTSTSTVYLSNKNGVEGYSVRITGTGTVTTLTVDASGSPVTAPTKSTTTFGALSSTVANEITAIATALSLTAPTSTTSVNVSTPTPPATGAAVYTVSLTSSSGSHRHGAVIQVDTNGNPVGNTSLPFSVIPAAIQSALNNNAPVGATAIDASSTQKVSVRTADGATTYTVKFTATGTTTSVTVDAKGNLHSLPSRSTVQFSTIPVAAQTELQTLATADGATGTIATTQNVTAFDEANGTVVYAVSVAVPNSSGTGTHNVTIAADENGNPTVPANDIRFGGGCGGGFFGGLDLGGGSTTTSGGFFKSNRRR